MTRTRRTATALGLAAAIAFTGACSSKRQIDPETTGSQPIAGTSWLFFCDGPNAVIWVQSRTDSEPDELEAYVYDHHECAGAFYAENPNNAPTTPPADDDGISEEDE